MFWRKERDKNRKLYATPSRKLHGGWWVLLAVCMAYTIIPVTLMITEGQTENMPPLLMICSVLDLFVIVLMIREWRWLEGGYQRFYEYKGVLGRNTICSIGELAKKVGKKPAFVVKDLNTMIRRKWFLEGVLEEQAQYLITDLDTRDAYWKIRDKLIRIRERQTEEAAREQDPRVSELLVRSDVFIGQLLDFWVANMSVQIVPRVEKMIEWIFRIRQNAIEHPEKAMNLKSLLERYLPTVVRLLESYEKMQAEAADPDAQNTVRLISQKMDELNVAFDRLLKEEMQKRIVDASADIFVLESTMLRDGLTEDDLARMLRETGKK